VGELLLKNENPILEFKREVHRIDDNNQNIRQQATDELIKDIIALVNGNAIFAGETAYLIFGVDNIKNENGKRDIFDVGDHKLTASRLLNIVNSSCDPNIEDMSCDEFILEGKRVLLITIPPTPYVHETIKPIRPKPDKVFSERTAFIRREQSVGIASQREREAIAQIKRFRFDEKRNPPGIPFGVLSGGFIGGIMGYSTMKNFHKFPEKPELNLGAGVAGVVFGATTVGTFAYVYKQLYEIRSSWHKIPPRLRLPGIAVSLELSFVIVKLLGFVLSRLFPKPKI
jgi:hypothetical protein